MATDHSESHWYVMTHFQMPRFLDWLKMENAHRLSDGKAIIEPFYPYDFLKDCPLKDRAEASASIGDDFVNFVFLKTTAADIDGLVNDERNKMSVCRLKHYLDTDGSFATVPNGMMEDFVQACENYRGRFEVTPPLRSIEATDKVRIKSGAFAGHEALVTRVQLSRKAIHLDLAIQLVKKVMIIRMRNVDKSQVDILSREAGDAIRADFVEYTQNHLITILRHRMKRMDDMEVNQRDVEMLTRLYRYRFHEVKNGAARVHFLALMLICAHLCRYVDDENQLREKALEELAEINRRSESKAATDTRTYLWIALYISTHDPRYRDAAKQYVRDHQPKSAKLRSLVSLIRLGKKV